MPLGGDEQESTSIVLLCIGQGKGEKPRYGFKISQLVHSILANQSQLCESQSLYFTDIFVANTSLIFLMGALVVWQEAGWD